MPFTVDKLMSGSFLEGKAFLVKQKNYSRVAFVSLHGKPADINNSMYERYSDVYNMNSLALAREQLSEIIRTHVCVPHIIIAVASVRGQHLFHPNLLIVRLLFEGSVHSKKYCSLESVFDRCLLSQNN